MAGSRGRRRNSSSARKIDGRSSADWNPKTKLGKMVRSSQVTNISDVLKTGLPLREPEIIDLLLPEI